MSGLPQGLLPLFPLRLVVFPGNVIPLHIFEPRYKEMVGEAAADGTEFGIVLATREGISRIGCTVIVEGLGNRQEDGSFDVSTRGNRRFKILSLDQEKSYLRGEVEFFDDDEPKEDPLSFQLAGTVADLDLKAVLQQSRSEEQRLQLLRQFMAKRVTPTNGHGHN
ncbi:MAG TPA: LON peptidase substrate-binding domain-containing protein [Bryobacteraceae bacterium]|nr:LON peptidase substrate-binding domain-containing protein [Bryobacteraceae bacterium]